MADRNYSKAFDIHRAAPTFSYVWDDDAIITGAGALIYTGAWRPVTADDFAAGGGGGGTSGTTDMAPTIAAIGSGNAYEAPATYGCSINYTGSYLAKASAGTLLTIFGYNSGAQQFLRMYDGTGTNGNVIGVIAIGSANNFSADFTSKGISTVSGIFVATSSSPTSHSAGTNAIVTVVWK
jgi:hypothetical protein